MANDSIMVVCDVYHVPKNRRELKLTDQDLKRKGILIRRVIAEKYIEEYKNLSTKKYIIDEKATKAHYETLTAQKEEAKEAAKLAEIEKSGVMKEAVKELLAGKSEENKD